ncbi:MAG: YesL family protein [Treponema sp.]|nr:YesL family protein [Treponema sp.]
MALNINSSFFKFWDKFIDLFFLNLIMLVCCLPVITIGPAVTAAYAVLLKMVDDEEGYIYKSYFKYFKSNFKKGMILGIIFTLAAYALYIEWQVVTKMDDVNFIFIVIAILSTAIVIAGGLYVFPLTARYENTVKNTIKNSYQISIYFFGRTCFILFIIALEIVLFMWNKWLLLAGILVGPMIIIYTIAGMGKKIFLKIEQDNPCPHVDENEKN